MSEKNENEDKSIKGFFVMLFNAYVGVYNKYPLLFIIGNIGFIFMLPIDWMTLYSMGVELFAKLRGLLGA